jgi:hypothetical protein
METLAGEMDALLGSAAEGILKLSLQVTHAGDLPDAGLQEYTNVAGAGDWRSVFHVSFLLSCRADACHPRGDTL